MASNHKARFLLRLIVCAAFCMGASLLTACGTSDDGGGSGDDSCETAADCGDNQFCDNGTCTDLRPSGCTDGSECNIGQSCVGGQCVDDQADPCDGVSCPSGQVCQSGLCVDDTTDPCAGVDCPAGQTCDNGQCIDPCDGVTCPSGQVCDAGQCVDDGSNPCQGVACPAGQTCDNGQCVDDSGECITAVDCPDGQICENRQCVADPSVCSSDSDCASGEICQSGACIDDPSRCSSDNDCAIGFVCSIGTGECVECNNDSDCANGEFCTAANTCQQEPPECNAVGETCDPTKPISTGFVCTDLGLGDTCYETCQADAATTSCTPGSVCLELSSGSTDGACAPSQCSGIGDTSGCSAYVNADPTTFPDGAHCLPAGNGANLCVPAGSGVDGDACSTIDECSTGLVCGPGECTPLCQTDSECTDACIGENDDTIIGAGYGFCGSDCTPFDYGSTSSCPAGTGCYPISSTDGLCLEAGTTGFYESCQAYIPCSTDADCPTGVTCGSSGICEIDPQCADGATCVTFAPATAADPDGGMARCMPRCDASQTDQAMANATCPSTGAGSYCYDLNGASGQDGTAQSGVCFELCGGTASYGQNGCTGTSNACQPAFGQHTCWPTLGIAEGQACDPLGPNQCAEGSYCRSYGDGTGVCASYCVPSGTSGNAALQCPGGQSCEPMRGSTMDFGRCGFACTPSGYTDTSCPANLQSCRPRATAEQEFCASSGVRLSGQSCGDVAIQNCQPGSQCVSNPSDGQFTSALLDPVQGYEGDTPICRQNCEIFKTSGGTDCPSGQYCAVDLNAVNTETGYCLPGGSAVDPLYPCTTAGQMCGDNAYCVDGQSGPYCLHLCDYAAGAGCPSGYSCTMFPGGPGSPDYLIAETYGVCQ